MDCVMMFNVILLGKMVNLSDDSLKYYIVDPLTFQTFLNLTMVDKASDAKTIRSYRERWGKDGLLDPLFMLVHQMIAGIVWVTDTRRDDHRRNMCWSVETTEQKRAWDRSKMAKFRNNGKNNRTNGGKKMLMQDGQWTTTLRAMGTKIMLPSIKKQAH